MKKLAEGLGVSFKFDGMMNPRVDCSQSPLAVRLQPWEIVKMDLEDPGAGRRVEAVRGAVQRARTGGQERRSLPVRRRDHRLQHRPGRRDEHLLALASGRSTICGVAAFREGWDHFLGGVRRKKITRVTKCTACEIKSMCGMCPANAELEDGDPESPVDFLCHVAHLRAEALEIPVPAHGDCEYCAGGSAHAALMDSLESIRAHEAEKWKARQRQRLLPVLNDGRKRGGCSSCGR